MRYYEVAPTKIVRAATNTFTYSSDIAVSIGQLVHISIGSKTLIGLVICEVKMPAYNTKALAVIEDIPPLPKQLVATALWMSEYYASHLATVLQTILPSGLDKKRRARPILNRKISRDRTHFLLNTQQRAALSQLANMTPGTAILHGITGSGKTAVYIEYAKSIIATGKSAVVLVPEIALTSQVVAEFEQHFPDVILTHSRQTEAERHTTWLNVLGATKPIVAIGPRSALFLPVANIGTIIIDESHEPSFRQDQSPKYSALRVASILAKAHGGTVIQGSATPLIGEYYLAKQNKRPIITLTAKARNDASNSVVSQVDMTNKSLFTRHKFFSDRLLDTLTTTLSENNQALIFHNRRGSASTTLCGNCGWSALCERCFIPLVLHADNHTLRCSVCDSHIHVPTSCPECRNTDIIHRGIGTKLLETELRRLFPRANIARFDGDTANLETVDQRYQDLYDGNIDIIIGTQVIAKGLDLPRLRAVGIVQADAGLSLPDYSASERTFQLLAQVVGRVGRSSHPTSVVIQSYQPNAPAVRLGVNQDYAAFYDETLAIRRRGSYPPYTYLLRATCLYKTEAAAIKNARSLAQDIGKRYPNLSIFGPVPAFYERQRGYYRWQIVIKSSKRADLLRLLQDIPSSHWQTDIDPMSLL